MICHLPAICFSKAFSFPRRGPGFWWKMLSLFCTTDRVAKCLLTLFVWEGVAGLLSDASRKSAVAFWISTICCTKTSWGLTLTHAVKWSVPEETISSQPHNISSSENCNSRRSGKGLSCRGWMKLHFGRGRKGGNGASIRSQKEALSWGLVGVHGRESNCLDDLGCFRYAISVVCAVEHREIHNVLSLRRVAADEDPLPPRRPFWTSLQPGSRRVSIDIPSLA